MTAHFAKIVSVLKVSMSYSDKMVSTTVDRGERSTWCSQLWECHWVMKGGNVQSMGAALWSGYTTT